MSHRQVARPYANAIFELAQAENTMAQWSDMLAFAGYVAADKRMVRQLKDPQYTTQQRIAVFLDLGKAVFSKEMQNVIHVLAKFRRLAYLPEIAAIFEEKRAQAENVVTVEFISAVPVDAQYQARLIEKLKQKMQCDIKLHCTVDKKLLGGAIIKAGDSVMDSSVRGKLAKLGEAVVGI